MAEFTVTMFRRGQPGGKGVGVFSTRAEAEAFRAEKVAEGDDSVSYEVAHRDRPAGLANTLRAR